MRAAEAVRASGGGRAQVLYSFTGAPGLWGRGSMLATPT